MSKRTLTPHPRNGAPPQSSDRLPTLAAQSNEAASADPGRYRHAVTLAAAYDGAGEQGADAALYVGRELLRHPDADAQTVAAFAVKSAKQYAEAAAKRERAKEIGSAQVPYSLTDEDLALADEAAPDADPQSAYRYTLAALVTECDAAAMSALRAADLPNIDHLPDFLAWGSEAIHAMTANDRDSLPGQPLAAARTAVRNASRWARWGWAPGGKRKRPMTAPLATPDSGPASAIVTTHPDHGLTVDGLPWDEAAALLGIPTADPLTVALAALGTITHPDRQTLTPLAEVKRETAEDKRRHLAAQPVKKPSPRKRPKGGRLGTAATVR